MNSARENAWIAGRHDRHKCDRTALPVALLGSEFFDDLIGQPQLAEKVAIGIGRLKNMRRFAQQDRHALAALVIHQKRRGSRVESQTTIRGSSTPISRFGIGRTRSWPG